MCAGRRSKACHRWEHRFQKLHTREYMLVHDCTDFRVLTPLYALRVCGAEQINKARCIIGFVDFWIVWHADFGHFYLTCRWALLAFFDSSRTCRCCKVVRADVSLVSVSASLCPRHVCVWGCVIFMHVCEGVWFCVCVSCVPVCR